MYLPSVPMFLLYLPSSLPRLTWVGWVCTPCLQPGVSVRGALGPGTLWACAREGLLPTPSEQEATVGAGQDGGKFPWE